MFSKEPETLIAACIIDRVSVSNYDNFFKNPVSEEASCNAHFTTIYVSIFYCETIIFLSTSL
jgi:hypothetical protein